MRLLDYDFMDFIGSIIFGIFESGTLNCFFQWKGSDEADLVPAKEANIKIPQTVIKVNIYLCSAVIFISHFLSEDHRNSQYNISVLRGAPDLAQFSSR